MSEPNTTRPEAPVVIYTTDARGYVTSIQYFLDGHEITAREYEALAPANDGALPALGVA